MDETNISKTVQDDQVNASTQSSVLTEASRFFPGA